jgi:carboxylesterase type B
MAASLSLWKLSNADSTGRVGRDFADAGAANLGLRDAELALQWVQENIGAFGGDHSKVRYATPIGRWTHSTDRLQVTLVGQSAGSDLISLLYLQRDTGLFRSAVRVTSW